MVFSFSAPKIGKPVPGSAGAYGSLTRRVRAPADGSGAGGAGGLSGGLVGLIRGLVGDAKWLAGPAETMGETRTDAERGGGHSTLASGWLAKANDWPPKANVQPAFQPRACGGGARRRRLAHVDNIAQQDSAQAAFNQLARTFAAQVEALQGIVQKGEQKMTIQHVRVADGGQAVIGNVGTPAPREGAEAGEFNPMHWPMHPGIEMPRQIEAERVTVPGARRC